MSGFATGHRSMDEWIEFGAIFGALVLVTWIIAFVL